MKNTCTFIAGIVLITVFLWYILSLIHVMSERQDAMAIRQEKFFSYIESLNYEIEKP